MMQPAVIPAQTGIQPIKETARSATKPGIRPLRGMFEYWIPACAGMTRVMK